MLSPAEIRTFIDSDSASTRKQLARQGQRYYEGDHDIRNYRLFFINADGTPQEDKTRSNIKISHPFFTELESKISGLKVALFGSYGWGDGQWMRDWVERAQGDGAQVLNGEGLICNEAPDDDVQAACRKLGADLAAW